MATVKTRVEISLFRRAAAISNSCMPIIERSLREDGMTERELARRVRRNIASRGGSLAFLTLVGCGDRSAMIHTEPKTTDREISGIGYIDFGASYRGYKTDVTVPFVKGRVGARDRRIVDTVQKAYRLAIRSWRPGMPCWRLFEATNGYIESRGYKMRHSLGHGVGRRIHESPIIGMPSRKVIRKVEGLARRGSKKAIRKLARWERIRGTKFEGGMVFTIEPGAYVEGVGGSRIENTFLVSGKKLKALTKARLIEVR